APSEPPLPASASRSLRTDDSAATPSPPRRVHGMPVSRPAFALSDKKTTPASLQSPCMAFLPVAPSAPELRHRLRSAFSTIPSSGRLLHPRLFDLHSHQTLGQLPAAHSASGKTPKRPSSWSFVPEVAHFQTIQIRRFPAAPCARSSWLLCATLRPCLQPPGS